MEEFYLDSCGAGRLHCALWKPEGEPKAGLSISFTGHRRAYRDAMTRLRNF